MISVLVVDDQDLIRAGLAALIRAAPGLTVVGEAADGRDAVEQAAVRKPDLILMDIRMPVLDGVQATEQILAQAGDDRPQVLILTTFDLDEYVYRALRAGADGFLLKEAPPDRILAAIHTVAAGDTLFAPTVTRRLIEAYTRHPPAPPAELEGLTPRELQVCELVATAMSNTEIADALVVTEATVKTHLNRAMTKLNLSSRSQVVVLAYDTGLVTPRRCT